MTAIYFTEIIQALEMANLTFPSLVASLIASSAPHIHPINMHNNKALRGNSKFSEMKLIESKKFISFIKWTFPNILPFESEDGIPRAKDTSPRSIDAFFLLILNSSTTNVTDASKSEIEDDKAANNIDKKNNIPKIKPKGIFAKTPGNVINNRPGPDVGSYPRAKTAGNIANADNKAAKVSNNGIWIADVIKFSFLSK